MGVTDDDNTFTGNNKTQKFYKTKISRSTYVPIILTILLKYLNYYYIYGIFGYVFQVHYSIQLECIQMVIAEVNYCDYSFILTWVDVGKSVFGLVVRQLGHIKCSLWVSPNRLTTETKLLLKQHWNRMTCQFNLT